MPSYIRLYLVPVNGVQQVIDVDSTDLVLSGGQNFLPVQTAPSVTIVGASFSSKFTPFGYAPMPTLDISQTWQQEIRVCWREPVDTDEYPNPNLIVATDPSGGQCVCLITCNGTNLSYVIVQNVTT
jgi:hypothetical protein